MSIVSLPQHLASLRGRNEGPSAARRQQLEAVCEQFEAMFLQQILKQMRKAGDVLAAGNPLRSRELDTMRDLYDEALADSLATKRQSGISELLVAQLSGEAGTTQPTALPNAALAGLPALVLPCGRDAAGLPVGLQLIGPAFSERRLFGIARGLEAVLDYGSRVAEVEIS